MLESMPEFYPKVLGFMLESGKEIMRAKTYALFADVSGFTQISESMMSEGYEGAEKIRDILNKHFAFFSKTIYKNKGDILQYSGDAILAIFSTLEEAQNSMLKIIDFTRKSGVLSIRGGISYGDIKFSYYDYNGGYLFLSEGECVEKAMKAEQNSEIMGFLTDAEDKMECDILKSDKRVSLPVDKTLANAFGGSEINYGSFVFASIMFAYVSEEDVNRILNLAEGRLYINKVERYPEGIRIFLLTGVLQSPENPVEVMLEFTDQLKKAEFKKSVSAGFTSGYIFNGFTGNNERCEYNLIGKSINRAARIASKAKPNEILFDKEILEESSTASGEFLRSENLKGIGIVNLYSLKEYRKHTVPLYMPMYGRESEMTKMKLILEKESVVRISGDSGAGKTHFVSSFVYENNLEATYLNISNSDSLTDYGIVKLLNLKTTDEEEFDSCYKCFTNFMLGRKNNEVLIIDNYEKMDLKSRDIVEKYLKESVSAKTILISSLSRGDIYLNPFNTAGITGLIETRTGIPPSQLLAEMLYKKTNGNPYFVLAFFKSMVSENVVEMNYLGEWDVSSDKTISSTDISSSVQMIFSSLNLTEKNILKICSVFDMGCFEDSLMKFLSGSDFEIISKLVMDLVQKNILTKKERVITFVNDVVKEHIYKSILLKERVSLHRIAAKVLLSENKFLEAGRHLYLSGEREEAKKHLSKYAELAADGKTTLALYYALLLSDIEKSPDLTENIISLLLSDGRYQEAENLFLKEGSLLPPDRQMLIEAKLLVFKGDRAGLISFIEENQINVKDKSVLFTMFDESAFAMAVSGDPRAGEYAYKALVLLQNEEKIDSERIKLGGTFRELGDYENTERVYKLKYDRAMLKNNELQAQSILSEMIEMMPPGKFTVDYIIEVNEKLLLMLDKKDRKRDELKALKSLAIKLRDRGEYDKAMKYGLKGIDLSKRLKSFTSEIILLSQLARMSFNRGDNEKALSLFSEAQKLAEKNNSLLLLESIYGNMGVCRHVQKEYDKAYILYEKALEISLRVKHSDTRFLWILNLALLGVETKQLENADHYIEMARREIKSSAIEERWIDIEQIAANCSFLQKDYSKTIEISKRVLDEAKRRSETEIYYEALPYYAGSLIKTGKEEGRNLLEEASVWAEKKNSTNVKNNIEDVRRALNSTDTL